MSPSRQAWSRLLEGQSFVLACHQRPDGDALGSSLALAHILRRMGKDVVVVSEDGVPETYDFIPEQEMVVTATDRRDFDIGVLIDCEGAKRVGEKAAEAVASAKLTACVDHHIPGDAFGELRIVDQAAAATAEVLTELFESNEVEIDPTAAKQLMVGLVNDTGAFRFANTTPRTFRVAARLTECGADPAAVSRLVYETKTIAAMRLLGRAIASIKTAADGRVAWASVTRQDLDELGATDSDTDSLVNVLGWTKGASVVLLFREIEPRSIRISLRSREGVDVNKIARVFGGGGHAPAAGCTVEADLAEAEQRVVEEVLKWIVL